MSDVPQSKRVFFVIQQTCVLCDTADDACCVAEQTLSGTKGRILDQATDERVPYTSIYAYISFRFVSYFLTDARITSCKHIYMCCPLGMLGYSELFHILGSDICVLQITASHIGEMQVLSTQHTSFMSVLFIYYYTR